MADNVNITAGAGVVIHADEYNHGTLGSGKTQLVKLVDGTLDSDTPIAVDIGVKANALRVCPANNITDATYIGNVKVTSGAITETNSGSIKTAVELIDNAIDGNYLNVNLNINGTDCDGGSGGQGAQTQRVILATDDPAVTLLTTIDSDTNDIKTAVEKMDDWDVTHASPASADGVQIMGTAYSTALPTDVGAEADAARLLTDRYGRLCTGLQPQAAKAILDNADVTTAREIVAAVASRKIYVTSLIISVDTAANYWLEDEDGTAVTGKMYFATNGGCAQTFPEGTPLNTVTVNKGLFIKGSASGNVGVTVTYYLAV